MFISKHHLGFAWDVDTADLNQWASAPTGLQAELTWPLLSKSIGRQAADRQPNQDSNRLTSDAPAGVGFSAPDSPAMGVESVAAVMAIQSVTLSEPPGISELQLASYTYGKTTVYGSNFTLAWKYTSGANVTIALVDDGFDTATTGTFVNFSRSLSSAIGTGSSAALNEPTGSSHGTSTASVIGGSGLYNTPTGLAPNATIVGVKVDFSTAGIATLAQAEQYAASVASVLNNSWGYTGYAEGEPNNPAFAVWYAAIQSAVASARHGLGDVITVAAGNDRTTGNNLAVQPITADYRMIAVAASDINGTVASYSDPGSALLVAAVGDNVAVANIGGKGNTTATGTSYAAPTVAAIAGMMLSVNPGLGWRDVQEILADAAYMPPPSVGSFVFNVGTGWNGGGMQFSNDLGFGVVDANVAINLARAWTQVSTSANLAVATVTQSTAFNVGRNTTASSTVADTAAIRIQHVQVTINDTYLPEAWSKIVLISPNKTQSVLVNQVGLIGGVDQTGGLDVSGSVITSNAFWGELASGTWTLQVQDIQGKSTGTIRSWSLTVIGDNAATVQAPLVYTPEFAALATAAREVVKPGSSTTIDLIALPATTTINLNGGAGMIDGIGVTVGAGLKNANADGSTGAVTLTGLTKGGSELTGGDGISTLIGSSGDTINAGLGTTTIKTGSGGSKVTLSSVAPSTVSITSGGGDTIYAGLATVSITNTGSKGDTIYDQSAKLTFINGSGASVLYAGTGYVMVQAGAGGGTYYGGSAGGNFLTAGSGVVTFYGAGSGDVLTAAGTGADRLIAGAGAETLSGGASTGAVVLQAGSGTDTMIAGKGKTTFILGSGTSNITVGGTSNIIQIQSGSAGGLNTVTGFKLGMADLQLINFGPQAMNSAINTQKPDGHGGTMLTFTDNTRIDLVGITKVTSGFFV